MTLLMIAGAAWTAVAAPLALLLGRSIRLADEVADQRVPDLVPAEWSAEAAGSR